MALLLGVFIHFFRACSVRYYALWFGCGGRYRQILPVCEELTVLRARGSANSQLI